MFSLNLFVYLFRPQKANEAQESLKLHRVVSLKLHCQ